MSENSGPLESSDEETSALGGIGERLQELQLDPLRVRYHGKSSAATLIRSALEARSDLHGAPPPSDAALWRQIQARRPEYWRVHTVRTA
jgi:hypothetical protein